MTPAEYIGIVLAVVALWQRLEHRLTKLEVNLSRLPCFNCEPKEKKK
jgi:hypothetical protein